MLSEGKGKDVLENQLSKMPRVINEKVGLFNLSLLSTHLDQGGNMSQQNFWKAKENLLPKAQSVPHAVIDNLRNEITELTNIKKLCQSEFEYRLRKRNMKAKLKEDESAVNDLCRVRLEIARCNTTTDYPVGEVQNVVKELKLGKSVGPAGLIREVFIRGGSGLINYYSYVQCI